MFSLMNTPAMCRSVWCKPRAQGYWEAAKAGAFGNEWWHENLRISKSTFTVLCNQLKPYIEKTITKYRMPIPVDKQIAVTIWRLATNIEYRTISALFGIGISTVCTIV